MLRAGCFIILLFILLNAPLLGSELEKKNSSPLPDLVFGSADAPIEVVMYFALDCTHCSTYEQTILPVIRVKFIDSGIVRFIMREFPIGAAGLLANKIARCVSYPQFGQAIQLFLANQSLWNVDDKDTQTQNLKGLAQNGLGLGEMDFTACMNNQSLEKAIVLRRLEAQNNRNVEEVPAFFINGARFDGTLTEEKLEEEIRKLKPGVLKN